MSGRRREHGTPEGYELGCTQHEKCPALPVHGLTCETAWLRFASGERRYMQLRGRNLPAAAIADKLGITAAAGVVARPDPKPADAPVVDVEAQIAAYAAAKEQCDRAAAAEPSLCPECTAGKHTNCDGTAWDHTTDQRTTCACTHQPETTPEPEERAMPKSEEPTTSPATKPEPPKTPTTGSGRTREELAEIRLWARSTGLAVAPSGRVSKHIIEAYDARDVAAIAEPAEVGDYDYAAQSDALDETRARIEEPASPEPEPTPEPDLEAYAAAIGEAGKSITITIDEEAAAVADTISAFELVRTARPEWADVTTSQDVERARDLAARIEAENAILLEQLTTTNRALEITLTAYGRATDALAEHDRRALDDVKLRREATLTLLNIVRQLREDVAARDTLIALHEDEITRQGFRIVALAAEVDELAARRWWQKWGNR